MSSDLEALRQRNAALQQMLLQQQQQQQYSAQPPTFTPYTAPLVVTPSVSSEADRLRQEIERMRQTFAPQPAVVPVATPAASDEAARLRRQIEELRRAEELRHAEAARRAAEEAAAAARAAALADDPEIKRMQEQLAALRLQIARNEASAPRPSSSLPGPAAVPASAASSSALKSDTVQRLQAENELIRRQLESTMEETRLREEEQRRREEEARRRAEEALKSDTVRKLQAENERLRKLAEDSRIAKDTKADEERRRAAREAMGRHLSATARQINSIDLVLVMDCTVSMRPWIEQAKQKLLDVIQQVQAVFPGTHLRVGFVGYRDHNEPNQSDRIVSVELTENAQAVRDVILIQRSGGRLSKIGKLFQVDFVKELGKPRQRGSAAVVA